MRVTFDDKRVADEIHDERQNLCAARGCPNCWSISSSKLCSWHHWGEPALWPAITAEQQRIQTDRAIENAKPKPVVKPLTREDKVAILAKMRRMTAEWRLKP